MVEVFEGGKEFEGNMRLESLVQAQFEYMKSLPGESNPGRGGAGHSLMCLYGDVLLDRVWLLTCLSYSRFINFMGCPKQCSIITRRKCILNFFFFLGGGGLKRVRVRVSNLQQLTYINSNLG